MADDIWLLSSLVSGWRLGKGLERLAQARTSSGRAERGALGGHYRQPEREDDRKRGERGYDAGKKIKGRKRHLLVDTFGFLLAILVHAANIQDKPGAVLLLQRCSKAFRRLKVIFGDGGYDGPSVREACAEHHSSRLEVVKRSQQHSFEVLPKRWIVERTLAWLGRNRRLSKDYEQLSEVSEAFVMLAMLRLIVARIA